MPLPFLLAAAAAPAVMKGITGLFQLNQKVKKRDTTPAAFTESLAYDRQAANSNQMPGQGRAENNIAQGTAAVNAAALRAGGSSSDVLASLAASDAQQKQALGDLATQGARFQQQQRGVLRQDLNQQAQYQQANQQNYEREKAALREGGLRNIFGAVDGLSQVATYGLSKGAAPGGLSGEAEGALGAIAPIRSAVATPGLDSLPEYLPSGAVDSMDPLNSLRSTPYGQLPSSLMPYDGSFGSYGRRRSSIPMASY